MFAAIWFEITLAGFMFVAAFVMLCCASLGVSDFSWVLRNKDLLPYVSAAAIGISYVIGTMAHRVLGRLPRKLHSTYLYFPHLRGSELPEESRKGQSAEIWQFGSARVHREIDFQFALLALFRSLLLSVPAFGLSLGIWLIRTHHHGVAMAFSCTVIFWLLCSISCKRQWYQYNETRLAALHVARESRKDATKQKH